MPREVQTHVEKLAALWPPRGAAGAGAGGVKN